MEILLEHVGLLMWIISGLLTIVGWLLVNKIAKNDETIKDIREIVKENRDKFDDVIESMKEKVGTDIECLKKQTNELELNYNKKFGDVRQDISNLKEQHLEQHNELKIMLVELKKDNIDGEK